MRSGAPSRSSTGTSTPTSLCATALLVAGWLLLREDDRLVAGLPRTSTAAFAGAGVLLFLLLNIEIADFYAEGATFDLRFGARLDQDLTYTIGWLLFGLGLLAVGIAHPQPRGPAHRSRARGGDGLQGLPVRPRAPRRALPRRLVRGPGGDPRPRVAGAPEVRPPRVPGRSREALLPARGLRGLAGPRGARRGRGLRPPPGGGLGRVVPMRAPGRAARAGAAEPRRWTCPSSSARPRSASRRGRDRARTPPRRVARGGLHDLRFYDAGGREVPYLLVEPPATEPEWRRAATLLPIPATKKTSGFEADLGARRDRRPGAGGGASRAVPEAARPRRQRGPPALDPPRPGGDALRPARLEPPSGRALVSARPLPLPPRHLGRRLERSRAAAGRGVRADGAGRRAGPAGSLDASRLRPKGQRARREPLPPASPRRRRCPSWRCGSTVGGGNLLRRARVERSAARRRVHGALSPGRSDAAAGGARRAGRGRAAHSDRATRDRRPGARGRRRRQPAARACGGRGGARRAAVDLPRGRRSPCPWWPAGASPVSTRPATTWSRHASGRRSRRRRPPAPGARLPPRPRGRSVGRARGACLPPALPSTPRASATRALSSDGPPGLVAVPLDAAVLAHSSGRLRGDFADLRVVDAASRQLPYLLDRRAEPLVVSLPPAAPAGETVARFGPNTSVYRLTAPVRGAAPGPARPPHERPGLRSGGAGAGRTRPRRAAEEGRRRRRVASATWRTPSPTRPPPRSPWLFPPSPPPRSCSPSSRATTRRCPSPLRSCSCRPGTSVSFAGRGSSASSTGRAGSRPRATTSPFSRAASSRAPLSRRRSPPSRKRRRPTPAILRPAGFWALMLTAVVVLLGLIARLLRGQGASRE